MTDEQPKPWVHGSDEDIVSTIAHALRHEGKRAIRQADQVICPGRSRTHPRGDEAGLRHHTEDAAAAGAG